MPRYKITINGDVGFKTVKEENIENFLAKYPNAVLVEETLRRQVKHQMGIPPRKMVYWRLERKVKVLAS